MLTCNHTCTQRLTSDIRITDVVNFKTGKYFIFLLFQLEFSVKWMLAQLRQIHTSCQNTFTSIFLRSSLFQFLTFWGSHRDQSSARSKQCMDFTMTRLKSNLLHDNYRALNLAHIQRTVIFRKATIPNYKESKQVYHIGKVYQEIINDSHC